MIKVVSNNSVFANALEDGARREQERRVVQKEIHRQRTQAALLRAATGNGRSSDDYAMMVVKAQYDYGENKPIRGAAALILGAYGWLVLKVCEFFNMDNARWRGTT